MGFAAVIALLERPWLVFPIFLMVCQFTRALYRVTLHPLAGYPGPTLAAVSRWYEIYYELVLGGRFAEHIEKLHTEYGPIVRINPFEVHIDDRAYYDTLYNFDPHLEKRSYHIQNVQHTGDYETHKHRRRALTPFLSLTSIQNLEPLIKQNISRLCAILSEAQNSQEPVLFSHLYRCMTADIITAYTLGHSYDLLSKPAESISFLKAFAFTFRLLWLLREIDYLGVAVRWTGKLVGRYTTGCGVIPTLLRWQWEIDKQLQGFHQANTKASSALPAIIPKYIHNSLPSREKRGQPLHDITIMLLAAGFETTGFTLTTATYHILANPSILLQLQQELQSHIPSASNIPPWRTLSKLPYLSAVVKESLRLSLGASARLPRVNKAKEMVFGERVIPKGTAISMSHSDLHYNAEVFPAPMAFKPERWFMGEESKRLERFLVPFSRGARSCMGIHIANAELYLTLATLFRNYNMRLYETEFEDVAPARDFFVPAPEPGGNGLRVLVAKSYLQYRLASEETEINGTTVGA